MRGLTESVLIPAQFNGPLESGNGGYCAGLAAQLLGGVAEVSLRRPVPLDRELEVARDDGGSVRILDDGEVVIEGRAIDAVDAEVPGAVSPVEARRAAERYRGLSDGAFSRCFVCGRARGDAFGVFAGVVEGRDLVASPWTPSAWTADENGNVRPEFVWAVLDCPTYFALYADREELPGSVLARLAGRIDSPIAAGEEHIVIAWPIGFDGRKHHAGAAVLSAGGETRAVGRALLIAPR